MRKLFMFACMRRLYTFIELSIQYKYIWILVRRHTCFSKHKFSKKYRRSKIDKKKKIIFYYIIKCDDLCTIWRYFDCICVRNCIHDFACSAAYCTQCIQSCARAYLLTNTISIFIDKCYTRYDFLKVMRYLQVQILAISRSSKFQQ